MVSCEKCGKEFAQKGYYTKHKKNPYSITYKVIKCSDYVK